MAEELWDSDCGGSFMNLLEDCFDGQVDLGGHQLEVVPGHDGEARFCLFSEVCEG